MTIPVAVIRVIDLETTGLMLPAEPIEIGWCDIFAVRSDLAGEPCDWRVAGANSRLIQPKGAIPPETSAIHHLIAEDFAPPAVTHAWQWGGREVIRPTLDEPMPFYAAHSAKFEQQFVTPEWTGQGQWICTHKCALRMWPEAPSHSNQALRYWRGLALDRQFADRVHRAGPDAYVTAHLLRDMLAQPGITLSQLVEWSAEPALLARCHMRPYRGVPWRDVDDPSWLAWVLARDFDDDILFTARHHYDRLRSAEASPSEAVAEDLL